MKRGLTDHYAPLPSAAGEIVERTLNNSASYIQTLLQRLKEGKRLIVQAAAQAQKAADFILGTQGEQSQETEDGVAGLRRRFG